MIREILSCLKRFFPVIAALFSVLSLISCTTYKAVVSRPRNVSATPYIQRDVTVQGIRLRYIDEGSGPTVLQLPGHTSRIEEYDEITKVLLQNFRVLVLDLPGSGYSDKPDREYSLNFFEDIILGFLDALQVDKCYLFGSSLGGNLALRLAHRVPERFPRIAVNAPGSAWEAMPKLAGAIRIFGSRVVFWPVVKIQSNYWFRPGWSEREKQRQLVFEYYKEIMSPGFVRMYWEIAADQVGWSLYDIVGDIKQPTLLMLGSEDKGFGMDEGVLRISRIMPHARFKVFIGAGHGIVAEFPAEVARTILEFFSLAESELP